MPRGRYAVYCVACRKDGMLTELSCVCCEDKKPKPGRERRDEPKYALKIMSSY